MRSVRGCEPAGGAQNVAVPGLDAVRFSTVILIHAHSCRRGLKCSGLCACGARQGHLENRSNRSTFLKILAAEQATESSSCDVKSRARLE